MTCTHYVLNGGNDSPTCYTHAAHASFIWPTSWQRTWSYRILHINHSIRPFQMMWPALFRYSLLEDQIHHLNNLDVKKKKKHRIWPHLASRPKTPHPLQCFGAQWGLSPSSQRRHLKIHRGIETYQTCKMSKLQIKNLTLVRRSPELLNSQLLNKKQKKANQSKFMYEILKQHLPK